MNKTFLNSDAATGTTTAMLNSADKRIEEYKKWLNK